MCGAFSLTSTRKIPRPLRFFTHVCIIIDVTRISIQESVRTMSSPVEMESVSPNGFVVIGEMNVVIIQMNNSAVSVFLLTLLSYIAITFPLG